MLHTICTKKLQQAPLKWHPLVNMHRCNSSDEALIQFKLKCHLHIQLVASFHIITRLDAQRRCVLATMVRGALQSMGCEQMLTVSCANVH